VGKENTLKDFLYIGNRVYCHFNLRGELVFTANNHDPCWATDMVVIKTRDVKRLLNFLANKGYHAE